MKGLNFAKTVVWNSLLNKVPGHPKKTTLGRLRCRMGQLLVLRARKTSVFAEKLDLRGFDVVIGDNSGLGYDCLIITGGSTIEIGNNVTMGPRVTVACNGHTFVEKEGVWEEERWAKPIVIEDDCFVALGATILGGVRIGKRSVIGAGSVVTRDVPPYSFVGGIPARIIGSTQH